MIFRSAPDMPSIGYKKYEAGFHVGNEITNDRFILKADFRSKGLAHERRRIERMVRRFRVLKYSIGIFLHK